MSVCQELWILCLSGAIDCLFVMSYGLSVCQELWILCFSGAIDCLFVRSYGLSVWRPARREWSQRGPRSQFKETILQNLNIEPTIFSILP